MRRSAQRLTPNEKLQNAIQGALKATIDAHGPVTREAIPSAMKRMRKSINVALVGIIEEAIATRAAGNVIQLSSSGTCVFCGKPFRHKGTSVSPPPTAHKDCLKSHRQSQTVQEADHA